MRQDGVMQQQPRDFSLQGAVDLGARQAAQRRQAARASDNGDAPAGQPEYVIEVTDDTFNTDVVMRSRSVPVILDLWAEWCGPCKQLGPVLEKLAAEADGAWVLAKVDVDANPQLSAALQVQSIPMVVAVIGGQIAEGFLGAMPEAQVREWLGVVMQIAAQLGLPGYEDGGEAGEDDPEAAQAQAAPGGTAGQGAPGPGPAPAGQAGPGPGPGGPGRPGPGRGPGGQLGPAGPGGPGAGRMGRPGPGAPGGPDALMDDPAFGEAQQAMERGDMDAAAAAFEKVLAASPGHPVAAMGLAQVGLIRRVNSYDQTQVLREAAARPGDPEAQARAADVEVATGRTEAGFDRLLGTVRRTSGDERNQARVHLVGLFEIFPPKDPQVAKARAKLSSLLF
jgi:putative thioredoxin